MMGATDRDQYLLDAWRTGSTVNDEINLAPFTRDGLAIHATLLVGEKQMQPWWRVQQGATQ